MTDAGRLAADVLLPEDHHPVDLEGLGVLRAGLVHLANGLEDRLLDLLTAAAPPAWHGVTLGSLKTHLGMLWGGFWGCNLGHSCHKRDENGAHLCTGPCCVSRPLPP